MERKNNKVNKKVVKININYILFSIVCVNSKIEVSKENKKDM